MHVTPDAPTELIPRTEDAPPPARRRRGRVVGWAVAGLLVAALAAGAAVAVVRHRAAAEPAAPDTPAAVTTAAVERRTLSTARSLNGNIGFGTPRPLTGHGEATVTWLPRAGATISRGEAVFRADDRPVVLFYGGLPLFRPIAGRNLVGRDVRIIADNLTALDYTIGYQPVPGERVTPEPGPDPVQVKKGDGVLTAGLVAAIKRWQADTGLPVTGTIAVGDVEVQEGAVRVDALAVQPGSPANVALMSVTSTAKVITVTADLGKAAGIKAGDPAGIGLPDERTAKGRVVAVGKDLVAAEGEAGPPTLTVTVAADDPRSIADFDSAEVTVSFTGRTAENVLAVPIEALVALAEGGYAVQGPSGLVAVTTGMFADGWVEVEGAGLAEGVTVVVSS